MSQAYQKGSLRRVKRASGKAVWEWRYRHHGVMKQQTFPVEKFPTKTALWKHLQPSIALLNGSDKPAPLVTTMGGLIQRYRAEVLPKLARSSRGTDGSMLSKHIEPYWSEQPIANVRPMAVDKFLDTLSVGDASKARARRLLKQLYDRAMYWEIIPHGFNPIKLVKVEGASEREKAIVLLTVEQVKALVAALGEPYNVMVLIGACLGLRIEEISALQWGDFNTGQTVTIRRAWTHGEIKEVKTIASSATLPYPDVLAQALARLKESAWCDWLFPNLKGDKPRWTGIILQDHIQPVAKKLGLPHIGWHTLRHTYRSWLGSGDAKVSEQKDLMRHSSIKQTMAYGGTKVDEMRPHVDAIGASGAEKSDFRCFQLIHMAHIIRRA